MLFFRIKSRKIALETHKIELEMKFNGIITKSKKLVLSNREYFDQVVSTMAKVDKDIKVVLELSEMKYRRSKDVNDYYWKVVVDHVMNALIELGHDVDKDLTHEYLKGKFNYKEAEIGDGTEKIPQRTATLSSKEFWEYMERIKMWAANTLGVYIPEPNEDGNEPIDPNAKV